MTEDHWQKPQEVPEQIFNGLTIDTEFTECEHSDPANPHPPLVWPDGSHCDGGGIVFSRDCRSIRPYLCPCFEKSLTAKRVRNYIGSLAPGFRELIMKADESRFACGQAFAIWQPTKSPGLYLCGNSGMGKTVAAHRAAIRMISHFGKSATYISARRVAVDCALLATETSEKYRAEERLADRLIACRDDSIIVLDDLGRERLSEATSSKMCEFIDFLYERRAHCVFTTNLGGVEIARRYGRDIISRLCDSTWMTPVVCQGSDVRKAKPD